MEIDDLFVNLDWDPSYLELLFQDDFNDMNDLWMCEFVSDVELLKMSSELEKYCPEVEDISLDDTELLHAVSQIE